MSGFLDIHGIATHVAEDGPPGAPAVLLIHSLGTNLHLWDAQAAALARGHRVIRFDLRGHGLTEPGPDAVTVEGFAADALAVLDALGVEVAHVAGISIGGMVAQAIAAAAPARVRSLVLCDTALAIPPPALWLERAAVVRRDGLGGLAETIIGRWVSPAYRQTPAGRGLRAILLATSTEGYARAAEALAVADLTATTAALRVPALVVVGSLDVSTPRASAEALAGAIPGARLVVIDGAAHLPLGEHAEAVTGAILDFWTPSAAELDAVGARTRAEVLGDAHVARATAEASAFDRDFQTYLTRAAWGGVWSRPHFDRRTRSIVTLAVLAALGREHELALHVRAMRNTGATAADLSELLLHVAVYAGVPAANAAFRIAKQVLAEMS